MNNFKIIANATGKLFKKDELFLDFKGYSDFISLYKSSNIYDAESLNEIIRESLLWNDYFSEVTNTINVLMFSEIIELEALRALYISNKNISIIQEKVTMLQALKRELYLQKKYCMSVYYQAARDYRKSMKAFTMNDYVDI